MKGCSSYTADNCHFNDACMLTEESPERCASSCINFKVVLPQSENGNRVCKKTACENRTPKNIRAQIKVTRVKFSYGNKYSNNIGITVRGVQHNTSLYNTGRNSSQTDFVYNRETVFEWKNLVQENLEDVRIQVYTEQLYFIGQTYINISEFLTDDETPSTITILAGNVTTPDQTQNITLEVGVCDSCGREIWPCGVPDEESLCYQDFDSCSSTCTSTDTAHYETDAESGKCLRVCEERTKADEDTWPCGNSFETTPCYANIGGFVGDPECAHVCTPKQWYVGGRSSASNSTGACEIRNCSERAAIPDEAQPCADNTQCFYNPSAQPVTRPGADPNTVLCVSECAPGPHLAGGSVDGVCTLLPCGERKLSWAAKYPCGSSDCFYDPSIGAESGLPECVSVCGDGGEEEGINWGGNTETGVCGIKACSDRVLNPNATLPCETVDCFFDPAAAATPDEAGRCVTECVEDNLHGGEVADGVCLLRACDARLANLTTQYPCGGSDCLFYAEGPAEAGLQCVASCEELENETGAPFTANSSGVCVAASKDKDLPDPESKSKPRLPAGAVVGIVFGVLGLIALIILLVILIMYIVKRREKAHYDSIPEGDDIQEEEDGKE